MDLRRVRHFNVLAETLNFSRAAERLHIAQPALSVSIQKLESELGTRLFERTPTGVLLTPQRQSRARGGAAPALPRRAAAADGARFRGRHGGHLRIGFVGSAIYRLIPSLVQNFRSQYPGVELVLTESTSVRIMAMLHEEALDLGIVRTPLLQSHAATLHTLQRDRFVVALPAAHPLAASTSVSLARLAGEAFVMYSAAEATGLHTSAMAACEAAGFVPEVRQ